jgi:hypothetical protein
MPQVEGGALSACADTPERQGPAESFGFRTLQARSYGLVTRYTAMTGTPSASASMLTKRPLERNAAGRAS